MATKNPIEEQPIRNVSAPRAEPGAGNVIIPRRDLLTGAALVLVGSASGCARTAQNGGGVSSKKGHTDFVHDFTRDFIGKPENIQSPGQPDHWPDATTTATGTVLPGTRQWPNAGQCPDQITDDFQTFVKVLMTAGYVGGSAPATATGLELKIWQYLQPDPTKTGWKKDGWPAGSPEPTPSPSSPYYDVHLVEICVILDRLLQAINSFDVGNCRSTATEAAVSGATVSGAAASGAATKKLPHTPGGQWPPH